MGNMSGFQHNYPTFNLEDKVVFKRDGDVMVKTIGSKTHKEKESGGRRGERSSFPNVCLKDYLRE